MGVVDSLRARVLGWLLPEDYADSGYRSMVSRYELLRNYTRGEQKKPLVKKPDQPDDNLAINLTGLVVSRSVSLLVGRPAKFQLADTDTKANEYLAAIWAANKQAILLHDTAEFGAIYGTPFIKIQTVPEKLPRLIALNPFYMKIITDPEDMGALKAYEARYTVRDAKGEDIGRREVTERQDSGQWLVSDYRSGRGNKWELMGEFPWPYDFPPILHWKNLPDGESVYGRSDIDEDVIALQDAVNFVASNTNRIIRYHAHPKTFGRGFSGQTGRANWGADELIVIPSETGMLANLEMQSDLGSSTRFLEVLRQMLFDLSRTVDISSMADKLGALTNFGLRVLFFDAMNKLETKRALYGDALTELNRRLLVLNGMDGVDPGSVIWQDALPVNGVDQAQELQTDLNSKIVSPETAATKRGYDWKQEEERLAKAKVGEDNIGAALLRAFNQGK